MVTIDWSHVDAKFAITLVHILYSIWYCCDWYLHFFKTVLLSWYYPNT